jgi:HEAT repeat protein
MTNLRQISIFAVAACLTLGLITRTAHAERGIALDANGLDAKQRSALRAKIAKARAAHPGSFQKVASVTTIVVKLDREKRGPFASVSRPLHDLGKLALMPMLEMLALNGPARSTMTDTAWTGLSVSLIEAVGMQRDPVAIPVLDAIMEKHDEFWVVRAAAEALGRIGGDASAKKLAHLATTPGPKQQAVLSGIGDCRRPVAVHALAAFAEHVDDHDTTELTLRALGSMGNSWAWKTPVLAKTGDQAEVRGTAARALVAAFARVEDPALRLRAQKSILLVDDASTPDLIRAAKRGASDATRAALDRLAEKFAHNPLHKYE